MKRTVIFILFDFLWIPLLNPKLIAIKLKDELASKSE